jgi:hypothetical protein
MCVIQEAVKTELSALNQVSKQAHEAQFLQARNKTHINLKSLLHHGHCFRYSHAKLFSRCPQACKMTKLKIDF